MSSGFDPDPEIEYVNDQFSGYYKVSPTGKFYQY